MIPLFARFKINFGVVQFSLSTVSGLLHILSLQICHWGKKDQKPSESLDTKCRRLLLLLLFHSEHLFCFFFVTSVTSGGERGEIQGNRAKPQLAQGTASKATCTKHGAKRQNDALEIILSEREFKTIFVNYVNVNVRETVFF